MSNLFANAALSAAFVPVFTDLLQQGRRREALRLASTLFWIILIVLGAISAIFILAAGLIMPLFTGPTFTTPLDAFTVAFSQILFPVVMLIGLTGLFVGDSRSPTNTSRSPRSRLRSAGTSGEVAPSCSSCCARTSTAAMKTATRCMRMRSRSWRRRSCRR